MKKRIRPDTPGSSSSADNSRDYEFKRTRTIVGRREQVSIEHVNAIRSRPRNTVGPDKAANAQARALRRYDSEVMSPTYYNNSHSGNGTETEQKLIPTAKKAALLREAVHARANSRSNSLDKEVSLEDSQSRSKAKLSNLENKASSSQYSVSLDDNDNDSMEFPTKQYTVKEKTE